MRHAVIAVHSVGPFGPSGSSDEKSGPELPLYSLVLYIYLYTHKHISHINKNDDGKC